ncbi:MAG: hypothetical protein ABUL72_01815, partial [Armatimonadota bacterium]
LSRQNSNEDNMYALYRVEINPYIPGTHTVNPKYFVDLSRVDKTALSSSDPVQKALLDRCAKSGPDLNDPYMFDLSVPMPGYASSSPQDPTTDDPADLSTSAKAKMIRSLLQHARVLTESSRMDLIYPEADKSSKQIRFNTNVPQVTGMTAFRPSRVNAEPAAPQVAVRNGNETANAEKVGPDVYRTQYGSWDALALRIFPSVVPASFTYGADAGSPRAPWTTGTVLDVRENDHGGLSLFAESGPQLFDITKYQQALQTEPAYAFSNA